MAMKPPTKCGGRRKSPNKRPSKKQVDAKLREVAEHYNAREAKAREERPLRKIGHIRVRQLERVILFRCPDTRTLPESEGSRDFVQLVIDHCAHMQDGHRRAVNFISLYAPWFSSDELESYWMSVEASPPFVSAEEAGERIGLLYVERKRLRGPTMRCADKTREEVKDLQRLERNERDRERRRKKREPLIRTAPRTEGDHFIGERERAILSRLEKGWIEVPSVIAMMIGEPAFAGVAAVSMRMTVHRCIDRLESSGEVETAETPNEGKRTKLVRLKNAL